jgi:hypothetical protein
MGPDELRSSVRSLNEPASKLRASSNRGVSRWCPSHSGVRVQGWVLIGTHIGPFGFALSWFESGSLLAETLDGLLIRLLVDRMDVPVDDVHVRLQELRQLARVVVFDQRKPAPPPARLYQPRIFSGWLRPASWEKTIRLRTSWTVTPRCHLKRQDQSMLFPSLYLPSSFTRGQGPRGTLPAVLGSTSVRWSTHTEEGAGSPGSEPQTHSTPPRNSEDSRNEARIRDTGVDPASKSRDLVANEISAHRLKRVLCA